jgi:hypothetical protein
MNNTIGEPYLSSPNPPDSPGPASLVVRIFVTNLCDLCDLLWPSPAFPIAFPHSRLNVITMPARLTPKDLQVGASYLHRNRIFVRQIDAIEGQTVFYREQDGPNHQCSKAAFLKACPTIATPEDIASATRELHRVAEVRFPVPPDDFTLRDEANALTAHAFRNGFLEDLHAGKHSPLLDQPGYSRITDDEMKRLMIEASEKLARMLALKQQDPAEYDRFIRKYQKT